MRQSIESSVKDFFKCFVGAEYSVDESEFESRQAASSVAEPRVERPVVLGTDPAGHGADNCQQGCNYDQGKDSTLHFLFDEDIWCVHPRKRAVILPRGFLAANTFYAGSP